MFKKIAVLLGSVMLAACGGADETKQAALAAVQGGALLVDVRTAEEFATGHLPGAVNIPHGEIVEGLAALETPKSTEIVLYCRSGNRSGIATKSLSAAGFSNAMNAGGYSALKPIWDAAGS
ncbi:rhodanese-like domain-containing protein [Congregibacter sp.]|uniref:rhodanese-like domain-containing protein n=1 Tax=Congregibacter sp. TaxID=2744308 RepID=UPI003F6C739A